MRVLRISHSANLSAWRERERALQALPGVEVALVCPSNWQHLGQTNEEIKEQFLTRQAGIYLTGNVPLFAYDPRPIVETIKRFRPDLVDIHEEPYSVSGFECLMLAKKFAPGAAYVFYSAQNINKSYPIPFRWTEQYVYNNSHGAYPCSIGVQEVLREKGWRAACTVIPLGVDPKVFTPEAPLLKDYRLSDETFVIGFTGRLIEGKGLQLILQAIPLMREKLPASVRIKVLVAGAGPEREKLNQVAAALGVQDSLEWLAELKQSEMPAFYRSCSVVVVPSITTTTWKEQFGRVPVEAMSCGIPVVASDSGSLPEVVIDSGLVVPEQNAGELAQALLKLQADKALRHSCGERGKRLVFERYTWSAVADAMVGLYEQALKEKQGVRLKQYA